jgi:hypothetical protein
MVTKNFDSYSVEYFGFKEQNGVDRLGASIRCKDGDILVGVLNFQENFPLPHNNNNNGIIKLHLHNSHIHGVLTFLRYEKPLQLMYNNDDGRRLALIRTIGNEPVGEQE